MAEKERASGELEEAGAVIICLCEKCRAGVSECYFLSPVEGEGICGLAGCSAPGRNYSARTKKFREYYPASRRTRGLPQKDKRARYKPRFHEEDD